jgi:hypothetical protein
MYKYTLEVEMKDQLTCNKCPLCKGDDYYGFRCGVKGHNIGNNVALEIGSNECPMKEEKIG